METKVCTACNEDKPLTAFGKDANRADGYGSQCKQCKADAQRNRMQSKPHSHRDSKIKESARSLGLTLDEYVELRTSPCDICGKEGSEDDPNSVYQDKETSEIRGVICKPCARALGHFKHDPKRLSKALDLLS